MSLRIAIVLSRVLAATLILVGVIHLGLLYSAFVSLVFGRDVLVHLLPAFVFPGLFVAGIGVLRRRQWAYYLAYAALAANLFAWIVFLIAYPRLIADYYQHLPFPGSHKIASIALQIPGEIVAVLHVVPICLLAWTQYTFTKSNAWLKPLQCPTSKVQIHSDLPAIGHESYAAKPNDKDEVFPLVLSILAIALPSLLVFIAYPRRSHTSTPDMGGIVDLFAFAAVAIVALPFIVVGLIGTVVCLVKRGRKPRPGSDSNAKED